MFLLSISLRGVIIIASQQWGYLGVQSFHGNWWILWNMTIYRYRILGTVSASAPYRIINGTKTKPQLSLARPKLIDLFQRSFSLDHMISQCSIRQLHCWRSVSSASRNRSYSYTWGGNIQNSSILLGSLKGKSLMTCYSQGSPHHNHPLNHNSLHISSDTCASLL